MASCSFEVLGVVDGEGRVEEGIRECLDESDEELWPWRGHKFLRTSSVA